MRYLSVCSGIEAATVAWHPLGWTPAAFSEIEAFPRAVLAHHYPDVPLHGDFTTIGADDYGPIDLLVGGTPCQSFSVAGLRGGLADERGNLALEYLRLADRARPRWLVWENVPGVLSSLSHDAPDPCPPQIDLGGDDGPEDGQEVVVTDEYNADESHAFACFLAGLSELGYGWAYRVLDAQYAGVPQRRRRVFVVGHLGDWRRAAAVLFERHSLSGHPAPRREKGQDVAGTFTSRAKSGGWSTDVDLAAGNYMQPVPSTGDVSHCLNAGGMGQQDYETETLIAHSLRAEGFDASEDGTGRGTPLVPVSFTGGASECISLENCAHPVTGRNGDPGMVAVAFMENVRAELRMSEQTDALTRGGGKPGQGYAAAMQGSQVRRLTPRECERLQGFPDDYTAVPYRGKPAADGPRYKALGNSMAVPVMSFIGQRIQMVEDLKKELRDAA